MNVDIKWARVGSKYNLHWIIKYNWQSNNSFENCFNLWWKISFMSTSVTVKHVYRRIPTSVATGYENICKINKSEKKNATYWPLTEPSCSSCINRKTLMRRCRQLTQVDSRQRVTWSDNQKRVSVTKSYMQAPIAVTGSHRDTESREQEASAQRETEKDKGQYSSPTSVFVSLSLSLTAVLTLSRSKVRAIFL